MRNSQIKIIKYFGFFIFISILILDSSCAFADDNLNAQKEALQLISDFANQLCDEIPMQGDSTSYDLSLGGKIELNNFLKKLANIGVEAAGKYQKNEFQGILQKDLATAMKDRSLCKIEVLKTLKNDLLPNIKSSFSDVSGKWIGTWRTIQIGEKTIEGKDEYLDGLFIQQGTNLTLDMRLNKEIGAPMKFVGNISGNNIYLKIPNEDTHLTAVVSGNRIDGKIVAKGKVHHSYMIIILNKN